MKSKAPLRQRHELHPRRYSERFLSANSKASAILNERKIIGEEFIRVFEDEGRKIGSVDFWLEGTIYRRHRIRCRHYFAVIKSHHNVGGFRQSSISVLIEPLRNLFKDEVRELWG